MVVERAQQPGEPAPGAELELARELEEAGAVERARPRPEVAGAAAAGEPESAPLEGAPRRPRWQAAWDSR